MSTTTATAIKMPTPIPVLKIPPITLQELTEKARNAVAIRLKNFEVFMCYYFLILTVHMELIIPCLNLRVFVT